MKSTDNVPSTQAKTITPVPSTSNDPQLPQQVPKQQKVKKTLTDISRRFSKRILLKKQKDGNNQGQETVKGKQKKKTEKERLGNANYQYTTDSCSTGSN